MDKIARNSGGGYVLLGNGYVLWLHENSNHIPKSLNVYKIFNFSGTPKILQVIQNDKQPNESIDYFTTEWELLDMRQNFPNSEKPLCRPQCLQEMLALAKKLSGALPFVRTDFYEICGRVYFSEITFYSDAGMARFEPSEWDKTFGDWIDLSLVKKS